MTPPSPAFTTHMAKVSAQFKTITRTTDLVPDFTFVATDLSVEFTDATVDSASMFKSRSWDFGDDSAASTAASPTHVYDEEGTYSVVLSVKDRAGDVTTVTKPVTVTA